MRHSSATDPSLFYDVAVIRLDFNNESSIYEDVLEKILKVNPDSPVYAHSSIQSIPENDVHASSYFVVVSDNLNLVSFR